METASNVSRLILESFGHRFHASGIELTDLKKIVYGKNEKRKHDTTNMPKRKGYIIEQVADMDNLRAADKEAQAKGKAKRNRYIRRHNMRAEEDLQELQRMILEEDWPEVVYSKLVVHNDSGKDRDIARQHFYPWKILQHAIIRVIGLDIYRNLITDSFACVPGKGLHYGVKRLKMMLRRYPEYRYFWKADCKKYYQSIPHSVLKANLERRFKDKRFIRLMEITILSYTSEQDILELLEDEQSKTEKRFANRCKH